jgi:hypothetical protein
MNLSWLAGQRIVAVTLEEDLSWKFLLEANASLRVGCLWRILERGKIILTSEDHNQLFGHSAPINAQERAMTLLAGESITEAAMREGTLDIFADFGHGRRLEVFANSAGYESWELLDPSGVLTVAQGGGNLVTIDLGKPAK